MGEFCGILTGQHMYLDAGGILDRMEIKVTHVIDANQVFDRIFKHMVSYIQCGQTWTPSQGCRQFYMGVGGTVTSYNFDGLFHLNNMVYT